MLNEDVNLLISKGNIISFLSKGNIVLGKNGIKVIDFGGSSFEKKKSEQNCIFSFKFQHMYAPCRPF